MSTGDHFDSANFKFRSRFTTSLVNNLFLLKSSFVIGQFFYDVLPAVTQNCVASRIFLLVFTEIIRMGINRVANLFVSLSPLIIIMFLFYSIISYLNTESYEFHRKKV